ncbi:Ger(x)C family spore germination protein [Paenibacillus sp. FSL H7-0331]|uniref:Ger(x)C family spore germination protein n=1 Tax=Paenibacillus sp. FSL H7-0331 TaxID=1920421 RepID=UPI00096F41B4|nr:Ger(x)C family spore germination protein [Paenibacillus sp. FSL H7-0331]OMF07001.1 hypothetical protein BK127_30735 [Paenibacillus sp. FSL H7-0331]
MKWKVPFIAIMVSLLVSGCWDRRELDDIGIVVAVGLDKDSRTNEYMVTLQIVRTSVLQTMGGVKNEDPIEIFSVKDKTLLSAIRLASKQFDRKPFFAHNNVIVISEELAKEDIIPLIDVFRRGSESRDLTWIYIAKGTTAKEILGVKTGVETLQGTYLNKIIRNVRRISADASAVNQLELTKKLLVSGIQPVLGAMEIIEEEKPQVEMQKKTKTSKGVKITSTAVFKKNKLIGYLNIKETRGLNWVTQNAQGIIQVPSTLQKDKLVSIEIKRTHGQIIPQIINGKIHFLIKIKQKSSMEESASQGIELKNDIERKLLGFAKVIENEQEVVIEEEIKKAVRQAQRMKSDIFGFGQALHNKYPKEWKKVEKDWNDKIFPEVEFEVHVQATIRRIGLIDMPIVPKE